MEWPLITGTGIRALPTTKRAWRKLWTSSRIRCTKQARFSDTPSSPPHAVEDLAGVGLPDKHKGMECGSQLVFRKFFSPFFLFHFLAPCAWMIKESRIEDSRLFLFFSFKKKRKIVNT